MKPSFEQLSFQDWDASELVLSALQGAFVSATRLNGFEGRAASGRMHKGEKRKDFREPAVTDYRKLRTTASAIFNLFSYMSTLSTGSANQGLKAMPAFNEFNEQLVLGDANRSNRYVVKYASSLEPVRLKEIPPIHLESDDFALAGPAFATRLKEAHSVFG